MNVKEGYIKKLVGKNKFKIRGERMLINLNFKDDYMRGMLKLKVKMKKLGGLIEVDEWKV